MAISRWWCLMAWLLVVQMMMINQNAVANGREISEWKANGRHLLENINCPSKCSYRCSKSWKPEMCNHLCNVCCSKCSCVPDGPTARKETCPCYNNMKSNKGQPKCP